MHFGNGSSAIRCILCISAMDQWKSCQFYLLRQWIINNFIYPVYFDPVNCERALTKCKVGNSANTRTAKGLLLTESTSHQGPGTWYQVPGTTHLLPGNMYQVQCTRYLVPGTWYQVPLWVLLAVSLKANWPDCPTGLAFACIASRGKFALTADQASAPILLTTSKCNSSF